MPQILQRITLESFIRNRNTLAEWLYPPEIAETMGWKQAAWGKGLGRVQLLQKVLGLVEEKIRTEPDNYLPHWITDSESGHILGMAEIRLHEKIPHVADIGMVVAKTQRGRGTGSEALRQLIEVCGQMGIEHILTSSINPVMQRLFARAGFKPLNSPEGQELLALLGKSTGENAPSQYFLSLKR